MFSYLLAKKGVKLLKNISRRPHILRMSVVLLILLGMLSAFTDFRPVQWTGSTPEINLSKIGTKTEPTTDAELLRSVIQQIDQIQIKYGPGWVHWVMSAYLNPNDPTDPLFSNDGYHAKEYWYYVNNAGILEKYLLTTIDTKGKILQQIACGNGVCGNASLIGLDEFNGMPLANGFTPIPFKFNSAASLLGEINSADTEVAGWVENDSQGQILYISAYHSNLNNPTIQSLSPEFEGTEVVLGIYADSGALAYYKVSSKINGQFVLESVDTTTAFESVEENSTADTQIMNTTKALLERDRGKYGDQPNK